jgi:PKD repeat protein
MALQAVPQDTEYKTVMSEVLDGYEKGLPWEETWQAVQDKWGNDDRCVSYYPHGANIDAKINSAYVLMGLLYGEGDFEKSMTIAMRCGQDSDCNPSTVGGVLGTMLGYEKIPQKYKNNLDTLTAKFSYTNYTLQNAVDTTAELFKSRLTQNGEGLYTLTPEKVSPVALEQWPESPVMTFSAAADKDRVTVSLWAYSVPGIRSTLIDFGDGFVAKDNVAGYRYSKNGTYTITCTVTDVLGNTVSEKQTVKISGATAVEDPDVGTYRNLAPIMLPICSDSLPTGSGSKDIYVINDGKTGGGNTMQYDTYCGYFGAHDEYVGYLFKEPCTVDTVTFTEGMHFGNGGWFSGGTLKLQVFKDGAWVDVEATASPAYPVGNSQSVFGSQFEVYTFTFEEITCDGIRLFGTAGGDAGFISISELAVMGVEAAR